MKTKSQIKTLAAVITALLTAQAASAFYNPEVGRWANRDPIGEAGFEALRPTPEFDNIQKLMRVLEARIVVENGANLYAYVHNNPLSQIDPLGLEPMLPPGWHGPGKPYDPSANPFCKPGPPCIYESLILASTGAGAVAVCARGPSKACFTLLGAYVLALKQWNACLKGK